MKPLSFSELLRSGGCPLAAWRHRQARQPAPHSAPAPTTTPATPGDAALLGVLAHAVLEDTVNVHGWPTPDWQQGYDDAWDHAWAKVRPRPGSRLHELPNVFLVQTSLKRWLEGAATDGLAAGRAHTEFELRLPDADVFGIADLVTVEADGTHRLWDLKTGATDDALDHGSPILEQLLLYAALLEEHTGMPVASIGTIDRLGGDAIEYDRAAGTAVLARYRDAAQAMSSPSAPAARVEAASCIHCPWLDTCPDAITTLTHGRQPWQVVAAHRYASGDYLTLESHDGATTQTSALHQPNGLPEAGTTAYLLDADGIHRAIVPTPEP